MKETRVGRGSNKRQVARTSVKGRYSEFPKQNSVVASLGSHWLISLKVSVGDDTNTPFPLSVAFH